VSGELGQLQLQARFPKEFKIKAVKQVTKRGHRVSEVAARLGVSQQSLYARVKRYSVSPWCAQRRVPNVQNCANAV